MKCHASAYLNLLLDKLKCRFWVTETPASTRSSKINKTEKWKCFLDLTMRQNVSKVLNFRTLWKSLRRQRKSFSWSTLQSMECTILINNELDFSPLLTKITYTCSLLEIYCKINLFLEVKMCLKKNNPLSYFDSSLNPKVSWNVVAVKLIWRVRTSLSPPPLLWCGVDILMQWQLGLLWLQEPPSAIQKPNQTSIEGSTRGGHAALSLFPNQQYSRKSDSLEFFSTTVVVPPSAYRAILQISRRRSKTCGFSTIIIYYLRQCRAER